MDETGLPLLRLAPSEVTANVVINAASSSSNQEAAADKVDGLKRKIAAVVNEAEPDDNRVVTSTSTSTIVAKEATEAGTTENVAEDESGTALEGVEMDVEDAVAASDPDDHDDDDDDDAYTDDDKEGTTAKARMVATTMMKPRTRSKRMENVSSLTSLSIKSASPRQRMLWAW